MVVAEVDGGKKDGALVVLYRKREGGAGGEGGSDMGFSGQTTVIYWVK